MLPLPPFEVLYAITIATLQASRGPFFPCHHLSVSYCALHKHVESRIYPTSECAGGAPSHPGDRPIDENICIFTRSLMDRAATAHGASSGMVETLTTGR